MGMRIFDHDSRDLENCAMTPADQALIEQIKKRLVKLPEDLNTIGVVTLPFLQDVHSHSVSDLKALIELVERLEEDIEFHRCRPCEEVLKERDALKTEVERLKVEGESAYVDEHNRAECFRKGCNRLTGANKILREGLNLLGNHAPNCECHCMDHKGIYQDVLEQTNA